MKKAYPEFDNTDKLQIYCSCDQVAYIFVKDLLKSYVTKCKKCGKDIYQITCNKCKNGYAFPEDDESIHLSEGWWGCPGCKEKNPLIKKDCEPIKNYLKDEIPKEVLDKHKSIFEVLWSHWWVKLLIIAGILISLLSAIGK